MTFIAVRNISVDHPILMYTHAHTFTALSHGLHQMWRCWSGVKWHISVSISLSAGKLSHPAPRRPIFPRPVSVHRCGSGSVPICPTLVTRVRKTYVPPTCRIFFLEISYARRQNISPCSKWQDITHCQLCNA